MSYKKTGGPQRIIFSQNIHFEYQQFFLFKIFQKNPIYSRTKGRRLFFLSPSSFSRRDASFKGQHDILWIKIEEVSKFLILNPPQWGPDQKFCHHRLFLDETSLLSGHMIYFGSKLKKLQKFRIFIPPRGVPTKILVSSSQAFQEVSNDVRHLRLRPKLPKLEMRLFLPLFRTLKFIKTQFQAPCGTFSTLNLLNQPKLVSINTPGPSISRKCNIFGSFPMGQGGQFIRNTSFYPLTSLSLPYPCCNGLI